MQNLKDRAMKLKEDSVTLVSIDGQAVMLDVVNRCSYDPNETAFFILRLMEEGISFDKMRTELISQFDTDPKTASSDLDAFIDELLTLDLIEIGDGGLAHLSNKGSRGKKAYRSPHLGHPSQIAIAAGSNPVSSVE
jgi:hypothetical protein